MSARTAIATVAVLTALALPAAASARPIDYGLGGDVGPRNIPAHSATVVVEHPSLAALDRVGTDTGGASTLLVVIIAGSALLVGIAVASGTGRMRGRHGALRS
jgi:hypothetical protein